MNTLDFSHMSLDDFLLMLKERQIEVAAVLASEPVEDEGEEAFVERLIEDKPEKRGPGRPKGRTDTYRRAPYRKKE